MTYKNREQSKVSKEQTKIRLLAVAKIMNEGKLVRLHDIKDILERRYDIRCGVDTIRSDIFAIDRFMPIEVIAGRGGGYKKMKFSWSDEDGK